MAKEERSKRRMNLEAKMGTLAMEYNMGIENVSVAGRGGVGVAGVCLKLVYIVNLHKFFQNW